MTPRGGVCGKCNRPTGNLVRHERACRLAPVEVEPVVAYVERSALHVRADHELRPAQAFREGVTDLDVARVLYALENGTVLYLDRLERWHAPSGTPLVGMRQLAGVVHEMVRTGLLRYWKDREGDHLIPAKVHVTLDGNVSACHFAGEDLGPMRSRLTRDMALSDCLDCEHVIAHGTPS